MTCANITVQLKTEQSYEFKGLRTKYAEFIFTRDNGSAVFIRDTIDNERRCIEKVDIPKDNLETTHNDALQLQRILMIKSYFVLNSLSRQFCLNVTQPTELSIIDSNKISGYCYHLINGDGMHENREIASLVDKKDYSGLIKFLGDSD